MVLLTTSSVGRRIFYRNIILTIILRGWLAGSAARNNLKRWCLTVRAAGERTGRMVGEKKGTRMLSVLRSSFRFYLADSLSWDLAMLNHESPGKRVSPRRNMLSRRVAHRVSRILATTSLTPLKRNGTRPYYLIQMRS